MAVNCMFCDAPVSVGMRLIHQRYCSEAHKEAYLETMDQLGFERLAQARPRGSKVYEPCTKAVLLRDQLQNETPAIAAEPKAQKIADRIRTRLDLASDSAVGLEAQAEA